MTDNRMITILDRLLANVGQLDWSYDPETDGYYVRFPPETLVEICSVDRDHHHPYKLYVLSGPENEVESLVSSEDLPTEILEKLADLFQKAKRAERKVDTVLDEIINRLPEA